MNERFLYSGGPDEEAHSYFGGASNVIVDAHQHYWLLERGDYGWITKDAGILYEDYLPDRLAPELAAAGVDVTIAVQSAATIAETRYLLELCRAEPTIAGVVGWIDPGSESFAEDLAQVGGDPALRGFRLSIATNEDNRLIFGERFLANVSLLAEQGIPVDLLVSGLQLIDVAQLLEAVPRLRAVVNHFGSPSLAEEEWPYWQQAMSAIASCPHAYCKLSGLMTRVPAGREPVAALRPYSDHVLACFGPSRVMYGSDWPVCRLGAEYGPGFATAAALLQGLSESDKADVLGGTAARFYGLDVAATKA